MIRNIFTVGGWTLVSRVTGFVRDIVMAAVLGAGPVADAFFVAFRLPNHFRAIFAEGAFAAAFVPAYARRLQQDGQEEARRFADGIGTGLVLVLGALLALALLFTPTVVRVLAPGLAADPMRFELAVSLTRITFPYLLLMSIETLIAGTLNANHRFASAAGAPVLLNISMVSTLLLAAFFPTAGHAAAWGVLVAGVLQALLVGGDAAGHGFGLRPRWPALDAPTKQFLKALGPAIIGAGGVQLALFADTVIATFLPSGALSALYYADRINQLPIGVVGIAIGIVLLPEMSRRLAAGDETGAAAAQGRAIELTLLIAVPFVAAALVNILLKVALMGSLAQVGLALATSVGAWLNWGLLVWFARRSKFERPAAPLDRAARLVASGLLLGLAFYAGQRFFAPMLSGFSRFREETLLLILLVAGTILYAGLILALLGRDWLKNLLRDAGTRTAGPDVVSYEI